MLWLIAILIIGGSVGLFYGFRMKAGYRPIIKYGFINDDFIRDCCTATIEHADAKYCVKIYNDGRITVFHDMRFAGGKLEEQEAPEFIAKWFR